MSLALCRLNPHPCHRCPYNSTTLRGHVVPGVDAARNLARALIRAGAPDGDVVRGGMSKRSLPALAARRQKVSAGTARIQKLRRTPLVMALIDAKKPRAHLTEHDALTYLAWSNARQLN